MSEKVVTHAHRGESGMAPENTAAAFELAVAAGADFIETDVQLSADGQPVIMHDGTLSRTTDAQQAMPDRAPWRVRDFTVAELKTLDAGSWFDARFAGQRILTLDELLDLLAGRVGLNLELKAVEASAVLAGKVAAVFRQHPGWVPSADQAGRLIVGSFDEAALLAFHEQLPDVPLAFIAYDVPASEKLKEMDWAASINPDYRRLRPDSAGRVVEAGKDLVPWTVDSPEHWRQVIEDLGADGIITNYTAALENVLRGNPPAPGDASVVVEHIEVDPVGDNVPHGAGEHVVLRNVSDRPVEVSGWYLRDQTSNKIVVGQGYVVPAGGALRIHTGPGENDQHSYYNGRKTSVWDNDGDSASLHRADGTLVDLYAYLP